MKLKGAVWKIAGFFATADALPQGTAGSIAYVGTTAPYAIYAWTGAAWQATGQTFTPSVDIDGLATLEQATQIANAALASANRYADSLTRGVESELDALEERITQGYATKDYADTVAAEAAAELLARLQGTSQQGNALTDPFRRWTRPLQSWGDVVNVLDGLMTVSDESYSGRWRIVYDGRIIHVDMYAQSFEDKAWVQVVSGAFEIIATGSGISFGASESYHIYWRRNYAGYHGTIGGIWTEYRDEKLADTLASAKAYTDERTAPPAGGIFRPLYEAAGAAFNEQTGFYELNGLTDITEAQMAVIYAAPRLGGGGDWGKAFYKYAGLRTNICTEEGATGGNAPRYRFMQTFATARDAEFIRLSADLNNGNPGRIFVTLDDRGFAYCSNLREIRGIINYSEVASQSNLANTFVGCVKLDTVQIQGLKHNLAIPSPVLSLESLQYLVAQRSGTNAITVTLHADVLARVNGTETAWQQLKADAATKNITFA